MTKKRLAWCTDIHLDCVDSNDVIRAFAEQIKAEKVDGLLLTGDISNGYQFVEHVKMLDRLLNMPLYFVAGNHDFYGTSIAAGRQRIRDVCDELPNLHYMTDRSYVSLSDSTAIVGHDGWYDALNGDMRQTNFVMNDWRKIREFSDATLNASALNGPGMFMGSIVSVARKLADEAAMHVANCIQSAAALHKTIIVVTHVPPFEIKAARNSNRFEPGFTPWYTSKLMGDVLNEASEDFPEHSFVVFCGHVHYFWTGNIARNMRLCIGGAEYCAPAIQPIMIDVS